VATVAVVVAAEAVAVVVVLGVSAQAAFRAESTAQADVTPSG
jgi:hypothetical protein